MVRYLIDTNIFMGVENFEKFLSFLGEKSEKWVPYDVLNELDSNKWKDGEKAYKARRGIAHIEAWADELNFFDYKYDVQYVDDGIIQAAIEYGLIIISNDIGLTLKARAQDVETLHYKEYSKIPNGWTVSRETAGAGDYVIEENQIFRKEFDGSARPVKPVKTKSQYFDIKPLDAYQTCALDSLKHDNITIITGHAGTGKTLLSLAFALSEIQSGQREKLIIFVNPTKVRGTEELGFYTGDRTEKLLQNSIGAVLGSKLGDSIAVDMLMRQGKLEIYPISDIRGFEVGQNQILYITEAQNLNIDMIKLVLQRCSEKTKVILEGDPQTQLDSWAFEGRNNGLRRVVEVFKGFDGFGHVYLPVVRRSRIVERAEML